MFTQLEGTGGAKNNGEERLGAKGVGSRPVLARVPAVPCVVGGFLGQWGLYLSLARLGGTWETSPIGFQEGALSLGLGLATLCLTDLACGPVQGRLAASWFCQLSGTHRKVAYSQEQMCGFSAGEGRLVA